MTSLKYLIFKRLIGAYLRVFKIKIIFYLHILYKVLKLRGIINSEGNVGIMREEFFKEIKSWMYRNARYIDLCLWRYLFEDGDRESVLIALMKYQNDDGGFGNALEADNWNPNSSPITTQHALKILQLINFYDMEHKIYKGIWKYLNSEKDLLEYGWRFTIPSNDNYPHAPWWNYSEEDNKKEYFGITAELTSFILRFGDRDSNLYKKALRLADELIKEFTLDRYYGDMGIKGYITLTDTLKELELDKYDYDELTNILGNKIKSAIQHDIKKWENYGGRPSSYIGSPNDIFYKDNAEIMNKEIEYLFNTKPENDVWGITWTWFDNMDKYAREFYISENWWKGYRVIEIMTLFKNFNFEI